MDRRTALTADLEQLLHRLFGLAGSEGLNVLADLDLTFAQARAGMLLACSAPQPIFSVAQQLGISVHSAGRTIERLVELGIVQRLENPADRRVKLVSLTPRGIQLLDQHVADKHRALQVLVGRLPDDLVDALAAAVRPILDGDYLRPECAPEPDAPTAAPGRRKPRVDAPHENRLAPQR